MEEMKTNRSNIKENRQLMENNKLTIQELKENAGHGHCHDHEEKKKVDGEEENK